MPVRLTIDQLRALPNKREYLDQLTDEECDALLHDWSFLARDEQLEPPGDWSKWLYMAGRGAGKTRTGAEFIRACVKKGYKRLGLIAPTAGDARDVMVEGESGILAISWADDKDDAGNHMGVPVYEPSKRRLTWANGAQASIFSADEPERLRGPQTEAIWADELGSWRYPLAWDLAMFGLRLGPHPRVFVSTTPKPIKLLLKVLNSPGTVVTRGSTYSNRANLSPVFFQQVVTEYEGTRLGKQELDGELLMDAEHALWTRDTLDETRIQSIPEGDFWFTRIVVGVDPATTSSDASDETGIVVCGRGSDGHGYVLADYSGRYSPGEWASVVLDAFQTWQADFVIAERNQGGDMVKHTLESVDKAGVMIVRTVHASRGKAARAQPVAARWEKKTAHLIGGFMELEDQLCSWEPTSGKGSPDRLDAMVYAMTDCLLLNKGRKGQSKVKGFF